MKVFHLNGPVNLWDWLGLCGGGSYGMVVDGIVSWVLIRLCYMRNLGYVVVIGGVMLLYAMIML